MPVSPGSPTLWLYSAARQVAGGLASDAVPPQSSHIELLVSSRWSEPGLVLAHHRVGSFSSAELSTKGG